jgi:hypothetical protein
MDGLVAAPPPGLVARVFHASSFDYDRRHANREECPFDGYLATVRY